MLKLPLDFSPNTDYKGRKFFKTLLEKNHEFVQSRENNTIIFNLGFVLLPVEVHLIPKK